MDSRCVSRYSAGAARAPVSREGEGNQAPIPAQPNPSALQATEVRVIPVEFNPDFVARMIPKVEWAALLEAADHVRTLPLPVGTQPLCSWPGLGMPRDNLGLLPTVASG